MAHVETFNAYGENFRFEPPVEVGDRTVESLGELAAIASIGPNGYIDALSTIAASVDGMLAQKYEECGVQALAAVLTQYSSHGRIKHSVTIE